VGEGRCSMIFQNTASSINDPTLKFFRPSESNERLRPNARRLPGSGRVESILHLNAWSELYS
jgi:hypothetical protein